MGVAKNRKKQLVNIVNQLAPMWCELSLKIHAHPETALQEHQASAWFSEALENVGFSVSRGVAGMATSFIAVNETSINAPVIAFLAEYDSLPGLGHACGHNLSGAASCLAAHALVKAEHNAGLRLCVMGTPGEEAEEVGGKVRMIEHGLFNDIEFAMMAHAGFMNLPNRDMRARRNILIKFSAKNSSQDPGDSNALDAILLTFNALNNIRLQLSARASIDGVITYGGKIVKNKADYSRAQAEFVLYASQMIHLDELESRLRCYANSAAEATNTTLNWSCQWGRYLPMKRNSAFEAAYENNLHFLGIEVGKFPDEAPIGSTDCGNVSQMLPCIHPYFEVAPREVRHHTPAFTEVSKSETGLAGMVTAAKAMALTAQDLLADPLLRARVLEDFLKEDSD